MTHMQFRNRRRKSAPENRSWLSAPISGLCVIAIDLVCYDRNDCRYTLDEWVNVIRWLGCFSKCRTRPTGCWVLFEVQPQRLKEMRQCECDKNNKPPASLVRIILRRNQTVCSCKLQCWTQICCSDCSPQLCKISPSFYWWTSENRAVK